MRPQRLAAEPRDVGQTPLHARRSFHLGRLSLSSLHLWQRDESLGRAVGAPFFLRPCQIRSWMCRQIHISPSRRMHRKRIHPRPRRIRRIAAHQFVMDSQPSQLRNRICDPLRRSAHRGIRRRRHAQNIHRISSRLRKELIAAPNTSSTVIDMMQRFFSAMHVSKPQPKQSVLW